MVNSHALTILLLPSLLHSPPPYSGTLESMASGRGGDPTLGLYDCMRALIPTQAEMTRAHLVSSSQAPQSSNPFGYTKHAMSYRLLRDPAAYSISTRAVSGEEITTCSQPMEDLFISSQEINGMSRQFGVLSGYLWTIFVVPEDRSRLMMALSSAVRSPPSFPPSLPFFECFTLLFLLTVRPLSQNRQNKNIRTHTHRPSLPPSLPPGLRKGVAHPARHGGAVRDAAGGRD